MFKVKGSVGFWIISSTQSIFIEVFGSFMAVADQIVPLLETNQTSDSLRANDTLMI